MIESIFSFLTCLSSFYPKVKAVHLLVCFSVILGQNGLADQSAGFISRTKWGNRLLFCMLILEIKSWQKIIRVGVVKNGCGHPGLRTFKLAISHKESIE